MFYRIVELAKNAIEPPKISQIKVFLVSAPRLHVVLQHWKIIKKSMSKSKIRNTYSFKKVVTDLKIVLAADNCADKIVKAGVILEGVHFEDPTRTLAYETSLVTLSRPP